MQVSRGNDSKSNSSTRLHCTKSLRSKSMWKRCYVYSSGEPKFKFSCVSVNNLKYLQEGRPFCKCPEGLVPDPSPEIQCSRPDPCNPSPCGPGTTCSANRDGNPICRCLPGLVPKPDTITGSVNF